MLSQYKPNRLIRTRR